MEKFIFKSNDRDIDLYIKDINAKKTMLFVHGFNSNHNFAEPIYEMNNNFNIVSLDFPCENVSFELFVNIVRDVLEKVVKGDAIVVGHSLGAAITLALKEHPKIEKRILVSPLNPSITKSKRYDFLNKIMLPETRVQKVQAVVLKTAVSAVAKWKNQPLLQKFLDKGSEFNDILFNQILSDEFMKELDSHYREFDAKYIIGTLDEVISPTLLDEYLKSFGRELILVEKAMHNPFKANPVKMNQILNEDFSFKKRFFIFGKFYSKKFMNKQ